MVQIRIYNENLAPAMPRKMLDEKSQEFLKKASRFQSLPFPSSNKFCARLSASDIEKLTNLKAYI